LAELRLEGGIEAAENTKEESAAAKKRREKRERQLKKAAEAELQPQPEKLSTPGPGTLLISVERLVSGHTQ